MKKSNSKIKPVSKIAENLKRIKKAKGFSKSDLVRQTDLDYHTIAKIENGLTPDTRISTLIKIAKALKEPIGNLVK